ECADIQIDHRELTLLVERRKIACGTKTGIVDKPIDLEIMLLCFEENIVRCPAFHKVGDNVVRHYLVLEHQLIAQFVQDLFAACDEHKIVAIGRQLACECITDPTRSACYESNFHLCSAATNNRPRRPKRQ